MTSRTGAASKVRDSVPEIIISIPKLRCGVPFEIAEVQKKILSVLAEHQFYCASTPTGFYSFAGSLTVKTELDELKQISIQASPINPKSSFLCFEMNPSALGRSGVLRFYDLLSEFTTDGWVDMYDQGLVKHLGIALDIRGVSIDNIAVTSSWARLRQFSEKDGKLEKISIGKAPSNQLEICRKDEGIRIEYRHRTRPLILFRDLPRPPKSFLTGRVTQLL